MGYTHYWEIHSDLDTPDQNHHVAWYDFIGEVHKLEDAFQQVEPICGETTIEAVYVNGIAEDGHEDFVLTPKVIEFDFCKTARKPYDTLVTAILTLAKDYFGDWISVRSDGNEYDWQFGKYFLEDVLGREFN